jgi:S-DNA-T family DNA segregation ATPase FtsK/SpoIIIE
VSGTPAGAGGSSPAAPAVAVALLVLRSGLTPWWVRVLVIAAAVPALAWLNRPADKPIIDRVTNGPHYRKLTAELVRRAVAACGVPAINSALAKNPGALVFPQEISRDGPGYLAVVDLPLGVEASDVVKQRGRLASGLRLPLDQVWPEAAPGHTGRLGMWVGDQPASQMTQPPWPLLSKTAKVDLFASFPFATDPRLNVLDGALMYRNWLIGAMPGAGKTFALRLLLLAAALDRRAELRGYELKGSGDLDALEPVCSEFGSGADDDTVEQALGMLRFLYRECLRRGPVIKRMAKAGKAPENKVTPELAAIKDLGLHPLVGFIDECQNLFAHKQYGDEAGDLAEKVIKLGRALGIILILATQRPDAKSLPKGISDNAGVRFCLRVMGQEANDMVLGTSMYKNGIRATQFGDEDLGWGWLVGQGKPVACKGFYVDGPGAERVVARALELRGGPVDVDVQRERVPAYSLLDDVRAVWPAGEDALWSELIVPRLAALRPDVYGDWITVDADGERVVNVTAFGAAMKAAGVRTASIHRKVEGKGATRYGVYLDALTKAINAKTTRPEITGR